MTYIVTVVQMATLREAKSHEAIAVMTVMPPSSSQGINFHPREQNLGAWFPALPVTTAPSSIGTLARKSHVGGKRPLFG